MKIISGGQTGADRAALDAAIHAGIPHGGWIPRGRKTEEGPLPARYRLQEMETEHYKKRTEQNVVESDGTLIISFGPLTGGSALTECLAVKHDRPCLVLDLDAVTLAEAVDAVQKWLQRHTIETLNVAGPRASGEPRIYDAVRELLMKIDWMKIQEKIEESGHGCINSEK